MYEFRKGFNHLNNWGKLTTQKVEIAFMHEQYCIHIHWLVRLLLTTLKASSPIAHGRVTIEHRVNQNVHEISV